MIGMPLRVLNAQAQEIYHGRTEPGPVSSSFSRYASGKKWDYGTFKLHPLWNVEPEYAVTEKITVGGEPLFRGTIANYLDETGLHTHLPGGLPGVENRIYMSEGAEDAEGYGCIEAETLGGMPVLCSIEVDEDLFKALKPGYEGLGEWYVERGFIPRRLVRCRRIPKKNCGERGF